MKPEPQFTGLVRVHSPPGVEIGPVGTWDVPATEAEIRALQDGTPAERDAVETALCERLFEAWTHERMYGSGSAEPRGLFSWTDPRNPD